VMHLGDEACVGDGRVQDVVYVDWSVSCPLGGYARLARPCRTYLAASSRSLRFPQWR
jgi:hypothetical protein